ncbi:MAG: alanine--tRNA ligase [Actinomycetota bacterium]
MTTEEIRRIFLDFFAERGHTVVASSPLVPDDPTLLLTAAGMVQFKPYFLGLKPPPYPRATTVQKCFRAVDLEEVGKTARHLTFFEMLGNFSFGDYFKSEACRWAWELATEGFRLEPARLWATVFETDDEAARIWEEEIGVPPERVLRRGRKDNFWHMGVAGPCGPSSELLYDRGPAFGAAFAGSGEVDDERYLEIWNLVFMQHVQNDRLEITGDLPRPSVDTGAGLERIAAILEDVPSAFECDSMAPILRAVEEVTGRRYGQNPETDVSIRILTDHARAATMVIADGVVPSNEGRGYVLRRVVRRAVRHARLVGVDRPLLADLTDAAVALFAAVYPEVDRNRDLVRRVTEKEEARFDLTLRRGLARLEEEIASTRGRGEARLSGEVAFELHDTYGFPLDLTGEIAEDEGLVVDVEEFETLMALQRERARAARHTTGGVEAATWADAFAALQVDFIGYERRRVETEIAAIARGTASAPALGKGEEGDVVLERTPFYPEGGGQIGDRGEIRTATGRFGVDDTQGGVPGLIIHRGKVVTGEIQVGQAAEAEVEPQHREGARQSHTATHMIHWGLRNRLGEHARQHGSLVEPGRLRFDFSHFEAVAPATLSEIEEEVNRRVLADDAVRAFETTYEVATKLGALALFGEKYGDYVRVVEVGDYSKELCGGTHVAHTGQVGVIKILGESSIGAGIRRVEAYTGMNGLAYLNRQADRLRRVAEMLKTEPDRVLERLEKVIETTKALETNLARQRAAGQAEEVRAILANVARPAGGARLVVVRRDGRPVDELRKLAIALRDGLGSGVAVAGTAQEGRANIVVAATKDLVGRGISAQELLAEGATILGGGGGGRPDLSVAGGPATAELGRALEAVGEAARRALEAAG